MGLRWSLGRAVSGVGTKLGLPEYGLSEKIGGGNKTYDYVSPQGARASAAGGGGELRAVPKADGGFDFFMGSTPITYDQYISAGGQRPSGMNDVSRVDLNSLTTETGGDTGTGTPGTTAPRLAVFGGVTYNLDDPAQAQAYYDAQRAYAEDIYNTNLSTLGRTYDQLGSNLNTQQEDLTRTYGEQSTALQEALRRGLFQSANYYDRIAPSLYQTAEGVSRQEKQTGYNEGMTTLDREKSRSQSEIDRARSDLQYYRPLEEQQYSQQRQSVLDQIMGDRYANEDDIRGALSASSRIDPSAYNIAYTAPDQTALNASIEGAPTGGATIDPVTGKKKTTAQEPKTIEDYLYQLGY